MQTKLTLSVDPAVVAAAKRYASEHGTSVSSLVEHYLAALTAYRAATASPPILERLRGSLRGADPSAHEQDRLEKYQ
ncbi:MAG: antitoxin [Myxococcales bacterium]|nr:antitoxin [Myxococcales bacterium]